MTHAKQFHRYEGESFHLLAERIAESLEHVNFRLWRERIDEREPGAIAFAPAAGETAEHHFCGHGDNPTDICDLCQLPLSKHHWSMRAPK